MDNLTNALNTWNDKLAEIWQLLTVSPVSYNGGAVWSVMTGIHGALQAIAYGLLVLFFAAGVVRTCGSFVEVKKPEHALKLFIRCSPPGAGAQTVCAVCPCQSRRGLRP